MELNNLNNGSKVWIYSKANTSTIELSKKIRNKKISLKLEDEINNEVEFYQEAFIPGIIISFDNEQEIYTCEYNGEYREDFIKEKINILLTVNKEILYKADEDFGYKDNSQLRNLNIGNVLRNIQVCYETLKENKNEHIKNISNKNDSFPKYPMYTFAGGILIAINPYKDYDIYNDRTAQEFIGKNIINMEPHPFAIAEWTYRRMLKDFKSQSIIISGESGAGKTETSKHVLKYLSFVSNKQRKNTEMKCDEKSATIEECLLSSNPLLEVFGNSMTIRNDNSSRFGKYMKLTFSKDGKIMNASINTYLLAKSRVVHLPKKERNYHIFYHILNEMINKRKAKWGFQDINRLRFNYLENVDLDGKRINKDDFIKVEDLKEIIKNIPYDMNTINNCFQSIGVDAEDRELIYDLIASILLLGNIEYEKVENIEEDDCKLTYESEAIIDNIVKLWQMDKDINSKQELVELLTTKNIVKIRRKLSYSEAIYTRDSIARYLYEWLFNNIVELINIALKRSIDNNYSDIKRNNSGHNISQNSIGILDIFGFEDLEPNYINSFEQFLINYCNERLHSFFLEQLLYRDTILYKNEGIHNHISATPSLNVIELLFQQSFVCTVISGINPKYLNNEDDEEKDDINNNNPFKEKLKYNNSLINLLPYNIISMLDETGKIPMKGNRDHAFCNKVHSLNKLTNSLKNLRTSINRNSINTNNSEIISSGNAQINDLSSAIGNVIQIQKLNLEKTFIINHFAGPVKYTSNDFISKNTDFLSSNIENILLKKIDSIKKINNIKFKLMNSNYNDFSDNHNFDIKYNDNIVVIDKESPLSNKMRKSIYLNDKFIEKNNLQLSAVSLNQVSTPVNTGKSKSVSTMFVKQVQNMLTSELYSTQSHFIRCIKPNNNQSSLFFDTSKVYRQLQIGGILQILNIMIHGYPCRIPYTHIYNYFRQLVEINQELNSLDNDVNNIKIKARELLRDERLFVSLLLEYMGYKNQIDYQLGLTRVFFKFNVLDRIEQFIHKCDQTNSISWKIECINSLYNHWLRKKCLNYWNMLKCCFILYSNYKFIKKRNASRIIFRNIKNYIMNKRKELERIRREQEEIERLRKEQEEIERIRKEQEEIERIRKEQEENERIRKEQKEIERIEKDPGIKTIKEVQRSKKKQDKINKDISKLNISYSFNRKVKRSRDEFTEDHEDEKLYLDEHLTNDKKKIKNNEDQVIDLKIGSSNDDSDTSSLINSPLLCTSTMRGKKRYSQYYIDGNNQEDDTNKNISEIKTLQDELVEAEFIEDIFNRDQVNDIENIYLDNNIKTGIKRPTIFIPDTNDLKSISDTIDNIKQNSLSESNPTNNIKKTLKDIQKSFRDNIIKQKKQI